MLLRIKNTSGKVHNINTDHIIRIKEGLFGYKITLSNRDTITVGETVFQSIQEAMNK